MDKDKLTDRIDLTEENIENIDDPQASSHFKRIFEEDGKMLEEEALASSYEVDEERKEALRLRILEAAAAQGLLDDEDVEVRDAAGSGNTAVEAEVAESAEDKEGKKRAKTRKRSYSSMLRWAAVIALVCLGVLGMSVTSQAKGSGVWSTIQRLLGVETRWQQSDNGKDRTYISAQEEKAFNEIEEKLEIQMPEFFYWPDELKFVNAEILDNEHCFLIRYQYENRFVYFEGNGDNSDGSVTKVWEAEENAYYVEYDGIKYSITKTITADNIEYHYVEWNIDGMKYILNGTISETELEKILKNIKN